MLSITSEGLQTFSATGGIFAMQVFEALWGTNELLSSFDSINVTPPSAKTGTPHDTSSWIHVDQAPLRRGFFCVQGIVNMTDVGPDTTGEFFQVMLCNQLWATVVLSCMIQM